jgi:hypothetical protein
VHVFHGRAEHPPRERAHQLLLRQAHHVTRELLVPKPDGSTCSRSDKPSAGVICRSRRRGLVLIYPKHFGLTRHAFDKDLTVDDFRLASLAEFSARLKHLVDISDSSFNSRRQCLSIS